MTENFIESVRHIQPADMPIPRPTEVVSVHVMGAHGAEGSGAYDVPVAVVMRASVIEVGVKTPLRGIARPQEVLPIEVANEHLLIALIKRVQLGVGIFLAQVEQGEVVLKAIVSPIAEESRAEVDVVEDKTAKVG